MYAIHQRRLLFHSDLFDIGRAYRAVRKYGDGGAIPHGAISDMPAAHAR